MWDVFGDHWMPLLVPWGEGAQQLQLSPHRQKHEVPVSERTRNVLNKGLKDQVFFRVWYQSLSSWIRFIPALEVSEVLSVLCAWEGSVTIPACLFHVFLTVHQ